MKSREGTPSVRFLQLPNRELVQRPTWQRGDRRVEHLTDQEESGKASGSKTARRLFELLWTGRGPARYFAIRSAGSLRHRGDLETAAIKPGVISAAELETDRRKKFNAALSRFEEAGESLDWSRLPGQENRRDKTGPLSE